MALFLWSSNCKTVLLIFIIHINTDTVKIYFFMWFSYSFSLFLKEQCWLMLRRRREINIEEGNNIFCKLGMMRKEGRKEGKNICFFFFFSYIKSPSSITFAPTLFLSRSKIYLECLTHFCWICATVWKTTYFGLKMIVDKFNESKRGTDVWQKAFFFQSTC